MVRAPTQHDDARAIAAARVFEAVEVVYSLPDDLGTQARSEQGPNIVSYVSGGYEDFGPAAHD
jgi:hypothetical protein